MDTRALSRLRLSVLILAATILTTARPGSALAEGPLVSMERAQQELFEKVAPSVVHITGKNGFGTGFFVTDDGLVLTNEHVVRGTNTVDIVTHEGEKHRAKVVRVGENDVDLALVQVEGAKTKPLKLVDIRNVLVGSWVGTVGHGWGGIWAFTSGMVSNLYPSGDARPVFQTQIPLNRGNSGGPVFDSRGRVVGIVTWGIEKANNINFAMTSEVAMFTFPEIPVTCNCLIISAPDKLPIFVNEKMTGKGPGVLVHAKPGKVYEVFVVKDGKMDKRKIQFPNQRRIDF